jgi:hypothetical protein
MERHASLALLSGENRKFLMERQASLALLVGDSRNVEMLLTTSFAFRFTGDKEYDLPIV